MDSTDGFLLERDRLTRRRLAAAAARRGEVAVLGFERAWWDGGCFVPCLRVRIDGRRRRVVETHGLAFVLPASARRARRVLAAWRHTPLGPPLAPALRRHDPGVPAELVTPVRPALPAPRTPAARPVQTVPLDVVA